MRLQIYQITKSILNLKEDSHIGKGGNDLSGIRSDVTYGFDLELNGEIDVDKSKWNAKGRNTIFNLAKKNPGPFWPYITKDGKKDPNIKV